MTAAVTPVRTSRNPFAGMERKRRDTTEAKGLAAPLTADERLELDSALGLNLGHVTGARAHA